LKNSSEPDNPAPVTVRPWLCLRRFGRDRSGAGALEFALVAPALIFLIVGIMQLGLALHRGAAVQWATETAIRQVMLDGDVTAQDIQASIQALLAETGVLTQVDVTYSVEVEELISVGRVEVSYDHAVNLPLMDVFYANFVIDTSIPLPMSG
jgi:Flp pilus assembly protein TadG